MGIRRTGRECALQMLYEHDVGKVAPEDVLRTYWQMNQHQVRVREFADRLFKGSVARMQEIDRRIQEHARNWRVSRMAAVDRNILRLAVFELLDAGGPPGTVIINEALEIAKKFSTVESAQFVNGILDSILNDLHEEGTTPS